MGEMITGHIRSADYPADITNKFIGGGQQRNHLVSKILHDLADLGPEVTILSKTFFPDSIFLVNRR